MKSGIAALESRGYTVVVSENARALHPRYGYLAGTDTERVGDLNAFLRDPAIDLILCARGGYGCARILDKVDWDAARANPKALVGYSDITALNLGLASQAGVVSFSGIMATGGDSFGGKVDEASERWFFEAVQEGAYPRTFARSERDPAWIVHRAPADGSTILSGALYPVCLTLLETLMGTPYVPDLTGAILLIEDVGEALYSVDRSLTQLRLAGILERLGGLLIGSFNGTSDEDELLKTTVPQLAVEMAPKSVPVVSGIAYGHIARRFTLPVGAFCQVDTDANTFTAG
jgi:muramoyltetrapeptide carboxypeptidase